MNKYITIFLLIISISSINFGQFDREELHEFEEFLLSKDLKVNKKELLYRFAEYKDSKKKIEKMQESLDFKLETNEFSYLNEKEKQSKLGFGIDGDDDKYLYVLRQSNTNPELLNNYMKQQVQNKMKVIKNDKKIKRSRYCTEKNEKNCIRRPINDNNNNPFEKGTLFYKIYELGGEKMLDVDWERDLNMREPDDQGMCGSCWAYVATASLESSYKKEKNKDFNLSEQELINCSRYKCEGGFITDAFENMKNYGIYHEEDYPFTDIAGECKPNIDNLDKIKMYDYVPTKNSDMLSFLSHLSFKPVSAPIYISNEFLAYRSGIMNCRQLILTNTAGFYVNHAVLAVGYFIDQENPENSYIRLRNSWSSRWGEHGYIRIKLYNDELDQKGPCSITTYPNENVYSIAEPDVY